MDSEDIKRIEQEIVRRMWDICKEYGDAFDIETKPIEGRYETSIKCNFPGLKFDEIILYVHDPTSVREFTSAERSRIKKTCYDIRVAYRYLMRSEDLEIPLRDLRKYFLYLSIYDRLSSKGYHEIDDRRIELIEKRSLEIELSHIFFIAEIIAIGYLANAILLQRNYKLGDIAKKRVLERAIGLYCYVIEFITSKKKMVVPEISSICTESKRHVEKEDFELLVLNGENFDEALVKIVFRAETRWMRDKLERWFRTD